MRKRQVQYPGTPRRRRQIIEAALACFNEAGFADTTMEDIRKRSKASNGSIYHHFKGKDQLAAAVYLEGIVDFQKGLINELKKHPEAREGVYAIVRYHLRWVSEHAEWARYLFQMRHAGFMADSEESINLENKNFAKEISAFFSRHIRAGKLRNLPVEIIIPIILGPCQEYARFWINRNISTGLDTAAAEFAGAAWQALRADGADWYGTDA